MGGGCTALYRASGEAFKIPISIPNGSNADCTELGNFEILRMHASRAGEMHAFKKKLNLNRFTCGKMLTQLRTAKTNYSDRRVGFLLTWIPVDIFYCKEPPAARFFFVGTFFLLPLEKTPSSFDVKEPPSLKKRIGSQILHKYVTYIKVCVHAPMCIHARTSH